MADITITVATPGATDAAGQMRGFHRETATAAGVNDRLSATIARVETRLGTEIQQLKKAAQAAKEYALAKRSVGSDPLTGGNSSPQLSRLQAEATALGKRMQMFRDFARSARADVVALNSQGGGSPSAGAGGPGLLKRIGRGIGAGGAVAGMGGPVGSLLAVSQLGPAAIGAAAAMVTLGSAASILTGMMTLNAERSKVLAEAAQNEAKIRREAGEQLQKQGLAAVDSQGDALLKLIGLGGSPLVGQANALAKGAGLKLSDVQGGLAQAQQITNPSQQANVIDAAKLLAQSGQSSFSDAIKMAIEEGITRGSRDKIAAGILGAQTDRVIDPQMIAAMVANLQSSGMAQSILTTRGLQARGGEIGQGQIGMAPGAVMAANAAALNPEMAVRVEQFRVQQEQIDVLRAIDEGQNKLYALVDRVWSPWANARNQRLRAESLAGDATFPGN